MRKIGKKKKKAEVDRFGWIHESEGILWKPGKGSVFGSAVVDGKKTWRACPLYDHPEKVFHSKQDAVKYIDGL